MRTSLPARRSDAGIDAAVRCWHGDRYYRVWPARFVPKTARSGVRPVNRREAVQNLVIGATAVMLVGADARADKPPAGRRTAMFFAPHPDDEVLQQLVEIMHHVADGWRVVVVGGSNGTATRAIDLLNGRVVCAYHKFRHVPPVPLTPVDIGRARIIEQRSACQVAGVHEYVPGVVPNEYLTVPGWRRIIVDHASRLADGDRIFVPTPWESTSGIGDPQHGDAGIALRQLLAEPGRLPAVEAYYTVFSRYWDRPGCPEGVTRSLPDAEYEARAIAAARVYAAYNPVAGSYGIGWCHSVRRDFEAGFGSATSPRYLRQRFHR